MYILYYDAVHKTNIIIYHRCLIVSPPLAFYSICKAIYNCLLKVPKSTFAGLTITIYMLHSTYEIITSNLFYHPNNPSLQKKTFDIFFFPVCITNDLFFFLMRWTKWFFYLVVLEFLTFVPPWKQKKAGGISYIETLTRAYSTLTSSSVMHRTVSPLLLTRTGSCNLISK